MNNHTVAATREAPSRRSGWNRATVASVVLATVLFAATPASAYDRPALLERIASYFAERPAELGCPSVDEWRSDPSWGSAASSGRAWGYTHMLNDYIVLHPALCAGALAVSDPLVRAARIRAEVDARYPGLRVTEASSTAVIDSVTLFTAEADPRVVPAANGIYYAVCPIRATCPYPGRGASRPSAAFAPRRLALELAVRTFLETDADLVLVSLPTPRFVLLVFERAYVDASSISEATANGRPASSELRTVVDSTTLPLLFEPFALERCANGRDTLLALSIEARRPPGT